MPKTAARAAWSRFWFSLLLLPVLHSCNHHSSESASSAQTAKDLRPVTHLPAESVGWTEIINNLVGAFDDVDVVALGETHGRKMDSDLRLRLIRAPAFSLKVRSIVVESANSLYQPLLDRYIQGDDIPPSDLAQVWRNVVAIRGADSKVYEEFFAAVREVNLSLPSSRRVRVVAGDPPIDWKRVHVRSDIEPFLERRDFPVSLGKTAVGRGESLSDLWQRTCNPTAVPTLGGRNRNKSCVRTGPASHGNASVCSCDRGERPGPCIRGAILPGG